MKLQKLFEIPYLNDEELQYKVLSKISASALKRTYSLISTINISNEKMKFGIFSSKISGFVAGFIEEDGSLDLMVNITSRNVSYPVEPTQVENYKQVSMVNVSKEFADRGFTKQVYNQIAKHVDLISDHEQYLSAQELWKSLAKKSDVNIYVFKGKDYVRDDQGSPVKYNGKNITDTLIWGTTPQHHAILLVATAKKLK